LLARSIKNRFPYLDPLDQALVLEWKVDLVIIEDTSSGMSLIQMLRDEPLVNVIGRRPKAGQRGSYVAA
jgi:hypothetical protein